METAEVFVENHKKNILIVLSVIMLMGFIYTEFFSDTHINSAMNIKTYTITDENGKNAGDTAISSDEDAMDFAAIYLRNHFRTYNDCDYYFSDNASGDYLIYQSRTDIPFDTYYQIYPHASVYPYGKIDLHLHRIF